MTVFALDNRLMFPAPSLADDNGLLAVGGDLCHQRLLLAYSCGIFPWNHPDDPLLWWSPNPRCVLRPNELHISRTMAKKIRQGNFTITFDHDFSSCIEQCANADQRSDGTWVSSDIIEGYTTLHQMGYAHSVECWQDGKLTGGLYGLAIGHCFCGESMFHTQRDASKLAFIALAKHLQQLNYQLIDCQLPTEHLHSLGAYDVSRDDFLHRLHRCNIKVDNHVIAGLF
ncbi:MAG: leucyl/phenylalanyl-tRNA--protein transferase [Thermodesulfobacteriota bacterium]|nr:leucyl/phenylalanyl-tRNA--protein transferase [Thermodesulfobacteriota bacterium]